MSTRIDMLSSADLKLRVGRAPQQVESAPAPAEFVQCYDAHFDTVWRICRRLGLSASASDDAAQDTFVLAHKRWHEFEGRSSRRTWLMGIAVNVARNHRRREAKPLDPLHERELEGSTPDPEEGYAMRQRVRTLDALLDRLTEKKRVVFTLVEVEGMTAPEIAELLGIELATVYSRLRAARVELDAALVQMRNAGGEHG